MVVHGTGPKESKMRYWLDTEFIEDGKTIDLISIGIVAEDGRELYRENRSADLSKASDWVKEHVIPSLHGPQCPGGYPATDCPLRSPFGIRLDVLEFCDIKKHGRPEFWGYYADYDWVAVCQLFGTMMDLPRGWPMYCRDLKQWCDDLGNPSLAKQGDDEHNALADARWNKEVYAFLWLLQQKERPWGSQA